MTFTNPLFFSSVKIFQISFQLRLLEANVEEQPDAIKAARSFRCEKISELEKKLALLTERNIELEKELCYEVIVITDIKYINITSL